MSSKRDVFSVVSGLRSMNLLRIVSVVCDRAVATVFLLSARRVLLRGSRPSVVRATWSIRVGWRCRRAFQFQRDILAPSFASQSFNLLISYHKRLMIANEKGTRWPDKLSRAVSPESLR